MAYRGILKSLRQNLSPHCHLLEIPNQCSRTCAVDVRGRARFPADMKNLGCARSAAAHSQPLKTKFMSQTPYQKRTEQSAIVFLQLAAFVAFVCFAVAAERPYIAAAGLEFFITLAFLLLYLLKLNKRFSYLCWPLMDVANSLVAAVFIFIISLVAVSTYSAKGTLIGGIVLTMSACLWSVDGILLFRKIFNKATNTAN